MNPLYVEIDFILYILYKIIRKIRYKETDN